MRQNSSSFSGIRIFWKWRGIILSVMVFIVLMSGVSFAAGDPLVNKLVEKGVLTPEDAQSIGIANTPETKPETVVPGWIKNTSLGGDFRLRYQYEDREEGHPRNRARIRYRLALQSKILDNLKVVFGLASGSGDPRSTNQTLDSDFSHKPITIDLANAEYTPAKWLTLVGGKFVMPIWTTSQLIWDSDIRPEGAAAKVNFPIASGFNGFLNTGFFIIDEVTAASGQKELQRMFALQPGMSWNLGGKGMLKLAGTVYSMADVKGRKFQSSVTAGTNTLAGGVLANNFNCYSFASELGFNKPFWFLNYAGLFGEYVKNPDPDSNNSGYLAGIRIGDPGVSAAGQWMARYSYRRLAKDAWPDIFPDSDFFGGATDVKGHVVELAYGLAKNVFAGVNYFNSERMETKIKENLVQVDFNFKF